MSVIEVNCSFSNAGTRNEVRARVLNKFIDELPGTGKGDLASRYVYYVEKLKDGSRIFLKRPARLNNGLDFTINVENVNFEKEMGKKRRTNPSHEDIFYDLKQKKAENNTVEFIKLVKLLDNVYNCKELEANTEFPHFKSGYSAELVIKVVKWFFIEQDITYWNNSGRHMLWRAISEIINSR